MTLDLLARLASGLLCATLLAATAAAGPQELLDAHNRSMQLYEQERYDEAAPFAVEALRIGELKLGRDHVATAVLIDNLAAVHRAQYRFEDLRPLYEWALEIAETRHGPESLEVAERLDSLAGNYQSLGLYAEAGPLRRRELAIYEN